MRLNARAIKMQRRLWKALAHFSLVRVNECEVISWRVLAGNSIYFGITAPDGTFTTWKFRVIFIPKDYLIQILAFFMMNWLFLAQNILINKSPCRGYTSFAVLLQLNWKKKKITFVSKRFRGKSDIFFDLNKENCIFLCEKTGNKNVCQRAICRTSFYWQQCSIWGRGKIFFSLQFLGFLHMWNLSIFPSPLCIYTCQ